MEMYDARVDWKQAFIIDILQIAAGGIHSLMLDAKGQVWATGYNASGQLGNNSNQSSNTPVRMDTSQMTAPIIQIAAGGDYSLMLDANGQVWATGRNYYGQLGDSSNQDSNKPVRMDTSHMTNHIIQIAAGGSHSLMLDVNGHVWTTGNNGSGQLAIKDQEVNILILMVNLLTI